MEKYSIENWQLVEPAKTNRFIIKIKGADIPEYLFKNYKIYNEGDEVILTTEFYETVQYTFNPSDFFNIIGIEILYLDPVGTIYNSISFDVKGSNFKKTGSYSEDEITKNKLRFVIDKKTIKLKYDNNGRN